MRNARYLTLACCLFLAWLAGCDEDGPSAPCSNSRTHDGVTYGTLVINGPAQLDELTDVNVFEGDLMIGHTSITHLDQLACLEVVTGQLSIHDNHSLTNVDGLARLTEVGLGVTIFQNAELTQLDGLANLASVGQTASDSGLGTFNITYNLKLASVLGLSSLSYLGGETFRVSSNPLLPTCQAEQIADQLSAAGWSGTTDFSGNDDSATCEE